MLETEIKKLTTAIEALTTALTAEAHGVGNTEGYVAPSDPLGPVPERKQSAPITHTGPVQSQVYHAPPAQEPSLLPPPEREPPQPPLNNPAAGEVIMLPALQKALNAIVQTAGGPQGVIEILARYGAKRVSDVRPEFYAQLLSEAQSLPEVPSEYA